MDCFELRNLSYYYQRILAEDPDNEEALKGVAQIADRYADLAQRELDQFHYSKAQVYRDRGLAVDPNNKRLLELESTSAVSDVSKRTLDKLKSLFQ
jgi:hypothetical protein